MENTLNAFNNSVNLGSNGLEMDVCRTKDDIIVVVHDDHLKRLCGVDKKVSQFN